MPEPEPIVFLDAPAGGEFGSSLRFSGYCGVLAAYRANETTAVMAKVEEAVSQGLHVVGFVSYEAAESINPELPSLPPQEGLPLVWFALYRTRTESPPFSGLPDENCDLMEFSPTVDRKTYTDKVARIKDFIAAGDCYQINYTFPLTGSFAGEPLSLYRRFCNGQKAPFSAYIDTGRFVIISASPELFFSLKNGLITTRPMKGTAPRGRWPAEDCEAAERLRKSPKERAENLMIVDLLRNDLGIIAETGSVNVESLFDLETYPTVHQLTSTITARLKAGTGLSELFRALFPCGSVTGAPKRRTMELIRDLESAPRGVYCGAIGYISPGYEALFSVAIRTLLLNREKEECTIGVGSGITWDAKAEDEYNECLAKGAFLHRKGDFHLIETLRLEEPGYFLLERHIARLTASAAYFGFPFNVDQSRGVLQELACRETGDFPRKVRLLLFSGGSMEITSESIMHDDSERLLKIMIAEERVDSTDPFRFHKSSGRDLFDRARLAYPDYDDILFLNERGEVTEGTYHNLLARIDGRLITPPITSGLLPGTMREQLLEEKDIQEGVIYPEDLYRAEEIMLVNSVRGIRKAFLG